MSRSCEACGKDLVGRPAKTRFCGASCRSRAHRSPKPLTPTPRSADPLVPGPGPLAAAAMVELEAAGRLSSVVGAQALALAARIESSVETGAAVASLSKEFRAVMAAALEGVGVAADPLDELRARRDFKRNAG